MPAGAAGDAHDAHDAADAYVDDEDDDDYVELILLREPGAEAPPPATARQRTGDGGRVLHARPAPARRGALDPPRAQPVGLAHTSSLPGSLSGSHRGPRAAGGRRPRPITEVFPARHLNGSARRPLAEGEASGGRHHRPDPDDHTGHGRPTSGG